VLSGNITPQDRAAHETGLAAFLEPSLARRVEALLGNASGRTKIIEMLAHDLRFANHVAIQVEPDEQEPAIILALLKRFGAGADCYAMSEDEGTGQ
jgi:hypothetical protein